ncbi:MAG: DUF1592 domain-containing protein [Rhodospirillaceae bacterium]
MKGSSRRRRHAAQSLVVMALSCGGMTLCGLFADGAQAAAEVVPPGDNGVVIRRLTEDQYRQLVTDVFGSGITIGGRFEPIPRQSGLLAIGAGKVGMTGSGLEQFDAMARIVAGQVVDAKHRDILIPCKPVSATAPDDVCASQFLSGVGQYLYRRPLTDAELKLRVRAAHEVASSLKNFYSGIELSLASMLAAPQTLFRMERAEPDSDHPGQYRLDAVSKASRLSFLMWNAVPDPRLLEAAAKGKLNTNKGLAQEVDRMIASPRLEGGIRAFFADMLGFDGFATLAKDGTIYPKYTAGVNDDAQEQTLRTIVDLLIENRGDYRDLFTTPKTFLTPLLASVYGVPLLQNKPNGYPDTWIPYQYAKGDPRVGILTQVSFVSLHSHPGRSSPTIRGKALREMVLCQKVPDPPGNVNFTVVQDTNNPLYKTARERLKAHANEAMCAGCHKITDPIGLALENFDSGGGFRTSENGAVLDTSGELNGISYKNAAGLGQAVHDAPATTDCLVRRLSSYALGRGTAAEEADWVKSLNTDFAKNGYRVTDLLRKIATSPEFYRVSAPNGGQ